MPGPVHRETPAGGIVRVLVPFAQNLLQIPSRLSSESLGCSIPLRRRTVQALHGEPVAVVCEDLFTAVGVAVTVASGEISADVFFDREPRYRRCAPFLGAQFFVFALALFRREAFE